MQVGRVYHVHCNVMVPPKDKFLICVACETPPPHVLERLLFAVVNSRVTRFVQSRPQLLAAQVAVSPRSLPFLTHDSFIDCSDLIVQDRSWLEPQLAIDPSRDKGPATPGILIQMLRAIRSSPKVSPRDKEAVSLALSPLVR